MMLLFVGIYIVVIVTAFVLDMSRLDRKIRDDLKYREDWMRREL